MAQINHNEASLSIVSSLHSHLPPPPGPPADLPAAAGYEAVACDGCEGVFHVSRAGIPEEDDEWLCHVCVADGTESRRWSLGKRRRLSEDSDFDGFWSGEVSVLSKHTPADNSSVGLPFGVSLKFVNSSNVGKRFQLQKPSCHAEEAEELNFEDTFFDKDLVDMGASRVKDLQFSDVLPVQYEDFFVLSLGQADSRASYYSTNMIFPVGYKSCWHDKITSSLFVCEVLDGGDSGPIFKITRSCCLTSQIPTESTLFVASSRGENREKKENINGFGFSEEENSNFQMLISDPPAENDSRCCLENSLDVSASDSSIFKNEIGEFSVEESSPSSAWSMVANKFIDFWREMPKQKCNFNFSCHHAGVEKDEDICPSLAKLSGSSNSFKAISINESGFEIETLLEKLMKWLDQDRFGLEIEFVQEILEFLPGVNACSHYTPLKKRNCYSSLSVTVGNGLLIVITKDGKQKKGEKAFNSLFRRRRISKKKIVQDPVIKSPKFPIGKPLCPNLAPEIVGDVIQVLEFFRRFSGVLDVDGIFSVEQLEKELVYPFSVENEYNNLTNGSKSALSIANMSVLKVLYSELQAKVGTVVDPSSDTKDSKPKRGRKKSMDLSVPLIGKKSNIIPLNELTWSELARRYILAMLAIDDNSETLQSGKINRCLVGDGGELCGSLIGVLGMEADALLLAQAMKKIFGYLDREFDILNVDDGGEDQPSASERISPPEGNSIPEWAQLLEPIRKLPTNVGARIRNCVNAALEKDPPEWAKEILKHSISKEVYKGNASGPTKKAVLSVLATVCGEGEGKTSVKERKKPDEEKKGKKYVSISDIIMRQCRIVWRQVANSDVKKVFCNLLSRRLNKFFESEDEGFLGSPANFSRPLDFRTIDLKLAVGAYHGLHEAFLEDVQEFWGNVRVFCVEKPELLQLAEKLSSKFKELYGKEVLALHQKLVGYARLGCLNTERKKEVDEIIISSSVIPKAPWEASICKICGIDKDDDLVLLCDTCDSEYHTYCLNPPLIRVPPGNWHCPSCVSKQDDRNDIFIFDSENCSSKRKSLGEFTGFRFNALTELVSLLENKDYWEFSLTERISLLKFLSDELLNSASIRQHLEQCVEESSYLQQKLRSAYIDLRNMKQKEEKISEKFAKNNNDSDIDASDLNASSFLQSPVDTNLGDSIEYSTELNTVKNSIMKIRESINSLEMQLMKLSGRREFLGADSVGRLYWVWSKLELHLCVIVNDVTKAPNINANELNEKVILSSPWVVYDSLSELNELVSFLRDDDSRERELKGLILSRLKVRFLEAEIEELGSCQNDLFGNNFPGSDLLITKAAGFLENTYGPWFDLESILLDKQGKKPKVISDAKLFRCNCLEPVFPSRYHCLFCHKTFLTKRESDGHNDDRCRSGLAALSQREEGGSSSNISPKLKNYENDELLNPYNFDNICSKFVTMESLKDLVREIGFLGSNGVPLFLQSVSPNLNDPALNLNFPANDADVSMGEKKNDEPAEVPDADKSENENSDKNGEKISGANCCRVPKSAMKPLVGEAYGVLIQLKINLLDIEAALPKAAVRLSKACIKRRWAWRSFVKSARTIDEMVQAIIVFEETIKEDYLKNGWWYWSSLSAAAKISSLSALALRIYSLDASIVYEKNLLNINFDKDAAQSTMLARKVKRKISE